MKNKSSNVFNVADFRTNPILIMDAMYQWLKEYTQPVNTGCVRIDLRLGDGSVMMQRINPQSDSYEALMFDVLTNAHRYMPKFGDRVLDLGAHKGMFSLYCAARGCQVTAYEPNPELIDDLLHCSEIAKEIGLGSIFVMPFAVSSVGGSVALYPRSDSTAAATILTGAPAVALQMVPCVTLREAIAGRDFQCCKVDVEGAEYEIFHDATQEDLDRIKFLTMEIHNDLLHKEQREELIAKLIGAFPEHEMIPVKVKGQPTSDVATLLCWR